ncbi:16S rRNA (cytosine(967)-C(5))-methyltransferase RsmB [bacterium]|nr:16S rRNA (cytosine(967)-C(5))-methyltransferase RsmB [bacterium]
MVEPRRAAVELYEKWLNHKFRIDKAVRSELNRYCWDERDKALYYELIYGTIRHKLWLEWIFRYLSFREFKPNNLIISAVTICLYQIFFLDRIPEYAAVNSAVNIVRRRIGLSESRWINAILRRACREHQELLILEPDLDDEYKRIALKYSFPEWMIKRWKNRFSSDQLRNFLKWNNRRPDTYLRINHFRTNPEEISEIFIATGSEFEASPINNDFIILKKTSNLNLMKVIEDGFISVQDVSQGLVAPLVNPQPGELILDLCAAPGGKTGHIAELCNECKIISTDKSEMRLNLINENVNRCGYTNVEVLSYNDVINGKKKFDAVLVDAPCTGTGVMSRRPDIRWRKNADDAVKMAKVQIELLKLADSMLQPKGRIIYSTCSIEKEENEGVVEKFLADKSNYELNDSSRFIDKKLVNEKGYVSLLGMEINGDGVFAARLERN